MKSVTRDGYVCRYIRKAATPYIPPHSYQVKRVPRDNFLLDVVVGVSRFSGGLFEPCPLLNLREDKGATAEAVECDLGQGRRFGPHAEDSTR